MRNRQRTTWLRPNEEHATYSLVTPFRLFKQNSKPVVDMHCVKYRNVTKFPGGNFVETHSFRRVSGQNAQNSAKTVRLTQSPTPGNLVKFWCFTQ